MPACTACRQESWYCGNSCRWSPLPQAPSAWLARPSANCSSYAQPASPGTSQSPPGSLPMPPEGPAPQQLTHHSGGSTCQPAAPCHATCTKQQPHGDGALPGAGPSPWRDPPVRHRMPCSPRGTACCTWQSFSTQPRPPSHHQTPTSHPWHGAQCGENHGATGNPACSHHPQHPTKTHPEQQDCTL